MLQIGGQQAGGRTVVSERVDERGGGGDDDQKTARLLNGGGRRAAERRDARLRSCSLRVDGRRRSSLSWSRHERSSTCHNPKLGGYTKIAHFMIVVTMTRAALFGADWQSI